MREHCSRFTTLIAFLLSFTLLTAPPAFARGTGHSSHHSSGSYHSSGSSHTKGKSTEKHKRTKHAHNSIPHEKRHVTAEQKNELFKAAGIPKNERKSYVIDHKVPLELGGTNDTSNLQVEPQGVMRSTGLCGVDAAALGPVRVCVVLDSA